VQSSVCRCLVIWPCKNSQSPHNKGHRTLVYARRLHVTDDYAPPAASNVNPFNSICIELTPLHTQSVGQSVSESLLMLTGIHTLAVVGPDTSLARTDFHSSNDSHDSQPILNNSSWWKLVHVPCYREVNKNTKYIDIVISTSTRSRRNITKIKCATTPGSNWHSLGAAKLNGLAEI